MCDPSSLRGRERNGNQCQETGGKIGKVIVTLMDNLYLLRSLQVMVEVLCPTMWLLQIGLLARPTLGDSFVN